MADRDLTGELVAAVREFAAQPLPESLGATVDATLLHALALAVGGSRYPAVDIVVALGSEQANGDVPIPGRVERLAPLDAAIAIGTAAHHDDFDDTHLATVIHPGSATLAAVWAAGHTYGSSGEDVRRAFAAGVEVQLRVGLAMTPAHYDDGWHITSTCGVIGAAVAAGLLAGLDDDQMRAALAFAASGTLGLRGAFRAMVKATHPGVAAANGLLAVDLARNGLRADVDVFGDERGFFVTLSPRGFDPSALLDGWGTTWASSDNVFKPYPTGVVAHPSIDAALELAADVDADDIVAIEAYVHPLVRVLTGDPAPSDGMAAKLSTPHAIAVALATGRAGLAEFTDASATDPAVVRLRERVTMIDERDAARDSARLLLTLADGSHREAVIEHARGSVDRPLTGDEFDAKIDTLIDTVLPGATPGIREAASTLASAPDLAALAAASTPQQGTATHAAPGCALRQQTTENRDGVTNALANFVADLDCDDVDEQTSASVLTLIATQLVAMASARRDTAVAAAEASLRVAGGRPQATVIATARRADVRGAAFANALAAQRFHDAANDPSIAGNNAGVAATIVASTLALAEHRNADSHAWETAVAAGLTVADLLTAASAPAALARWSRTGTIGKIAATAACARLCRLDTQRTAFAIGIATTQAAGLASAAGTARAAVIAGSAASDAVAAVLLAERGLTARDELLVGANSFSDVLGFALDEAVVTDGCEDPHGIVRDAIAATRIADASAREAPRALADASRVERRPVTDLVVELTTHRQNT